MSRKKPKFNDDIELIEDDSSYERDWDMPDFALKPEVRKFEILIIDKDTGECEEYAVTEQIADSIRAIV